MCGQVKEDTKELLIGFVWFRGSCVVLGVDDPRIHTNKTSEMISFRVIRVVSWIVFFCAETIREFTNSRKIGLSDMRSVPPRGAKPIQYRSR